MCAQKRLADTVAISSSLLFMYDDCKVFVSSVRPAPYLPACSHCFVVHDYMLVHAHAHVHSGHTCTPVHMLLKALIVFASTGKESLPFKVSILSVAGHWRTLAHSCIVFGVFTALLRVVMNRPELT